MNDNGLSNVMSLIKKKKWENLFKRRYLMDTAACKEFYANLTVFIYKKKEIARSRVKGVEIEFDNMKLTSILDVPGHTGISEYIKVVWEESKYIKPLEITRKFANNSLINVARRVQSTVMKPFQRFAHFLVMKNVVPRYNKFYGFDIHGSFDHELPYGDWMIMIFDAFGVPLVDKKGEQPKRYDYFEETFLTMCKLTRENGVWWVRTGENKRRDDGIEAPAEEVHEEEEAQNAEFDWEAVIDEAVDQGESGSDDQLFDAQVDVEEPVTEAPAAPTFPAPSGDSTTQQREHTPAGVDPSGPSGHLPESVMNKLQAEFERARAN
ncbi:hypothetical protein Dimus_007894 [Dionaea muscipula]